MATVYSNANRAAARHVDTQRKLEKVNDGVTRRATINLERADKTSRITATGYFPAQIESSDRDVDHYTTLVAPNAVALEFGHDPSGIFAGTKTKPPDPEYILIRAAIGGVVS